MERTKRLVAAITMYLFIIAGLTLMGYKAPNSAFGYPSDHEVYLWNGTSQYFVTWVDFLSELSTTHQTKLTNSAGLRAALDDETGTGVAVFNISPTIQGYISTAGGGIDQTSCTGRAGQFWYDEISSAFKFCNNAVDPPINLHTTFQRDLSLPTDVEIAAGTSIEEKVWTPERIAYAISTTAGISRWDQIENPTSASEIDFGTYVTELNVDDFRIGDGGANYVRFLNDSGVIKMTLEGNAVFQAELAAETVPFAALAASAKFQSLAVADLSDTTTPSVLTAQETTNKLISNYKTTGADHVFTLPPAHAAGNVVFMIGDEFQVDIEPPAGTALYLNGTAKAVDAHIINSADTLGEQIGCFTANLNGTSTWMCESKYSNFL